MKCFECQAPKMSETSELRDYDGVARVERKIFRCKKCKAELVGSEKTAELERQVALELAVLERELNLRELVWLRKYLGASAVDWGVYLGKTNVTVSRWENGDKPYPRSARLLLRHAAKAGAMEWPYGHTFEPSDDKARIELKYNSANKLYRS